MSSQVWMALAAGLPLGFLASLKASKALSSVARSHELDAAKADFERSLQETAGLAERPEPQKIASSPVAQLAANCQELAKLAMIPGDMKKILYMYLAASPVIGGYYGFQKHWDNRKAKQLEQAERLANVAREEQNPTFSTAKLISTTPHSRSPAKREQSIKQLDELVRQAEANDLPYM